jgi:fibronectin type 3 domain-containing protein
MKKLIAGLALCAALFAISGCDGVISSDDEKFDVWYLGSRDISSPTNVRAVASSSSIIVSWSGVSNATGYRLYRNPSWSDGGSYYGYGRSTSGTSYTDNDVSPGRTYVYWIVAYNSANNAESPQSSSASATVSGPAIPEAPTVTASGSSSNITVNWSTVSGATGYRVWRSNSSYGTYYQVGSDTTLTSYTDTGVLPSTTYYYKVSAYNSSGEGDQSDYAVATVTIALPAMPTGVSATADASSITVSWSSVSGAYSYYVYRSDSSNGTYNIVGSGIMSTNYMDNSASAGATYYYKVSAVSIFGIVGPQSTSPASATMLPAVPTGVTATGSTNTITVSWNQVSGATGYRVYRSNFSGGTYSQIASVTVPINSFSYTDTGLSPSTTYYYKVSASNSAGEGPQSSYYSAMTASGTPALPSSLLSDGAWTDGTLSSSNDIRWYSFSTVSGTEYYVGWNDSGQGDGFKNCDIAVSAYKNDGSSIFSQVDSAYYSPQSIPGTGVTVYLKVEAQYSSSTGAYAIKYSTSSW